jgi:hypothetical protein
VKLLGGAMVALGDVATQLRRATALDGARAAFSCAPLKRALARNAAPCARTMRANSSLPLAASASCGCAAMGG